MSGNQQNHLMVLLGAIQEAKRELVESQAKLNNTSLLLLQTMRGVGGKQINTN